MKSEAQSVADAGEQSWVERAAARVDEALGAVSLPREVMSELYGHARECYPEECCGLIAGPISGRAERVVRCTNVQSQRKSQGDSTLDATRAFWMDERELLDALRAMDMRGEALRMIYHSHVDTPAYLSNMDLRAALDESGRPTWPGVSQLVLSVREGAVAGAGVFDWDIEAQRFVGRKLQEDV